jgi:hypothetical protein
METTNFIVRIPEPCHEDWNKMQPDEKGKFCSSCSKSVFDFSKKTDVEIKNILLEHKDQKVCGHFKKSQIDRPLNLKIDLNDLPKNMSVTKTFAVALFLVFGTLLFSCTDQKDQKLGGIEIVNPFPEKERMIVGEIASPPQNNMTIDTLQTTSNIETLEGEIYIPEQHVAGGIGFYQGPLLDSVIPTKDSVIIKSVPDVEDRIVGMMVVNHIPADTTTTSIDSLEQKITATKNGDNVISKTTDLSVYPNPSKGEFTIKYDVTKKADVKVDILDIKGDHVKSIVNTPSQYEGKYLIPVSLNEFPAGIYIVTLINGEKKFSEKVVIETLK